MIGQETIFYKKNINVDSVISIDGNGLSEYLSMNIRYPIDAIKSNIMGTYIGCIRLNSNGDLIDVFTVNSLCNSIDNQFVSLIKMSWTKRNIIVKNLQETTDIIIPIQYKISYSTGIYDYYVSDELAPSVIYTKIVAVAMSLNDLADSIKDEELNNKVNEYYKKNEFNKCIKPLNELIRRNPYNADLILMRGVCYNKLKKSELECNDNKYLRYFLENDKCKQLTDCE